MKILITTDIHNRLKTLKEIKAHQTFDYHLDAGDSLLPLHILDSEGIISVKGNSDFFSKLPLERLLEIDGMRIFLIHGHKEGVKYSLDTLIKLAKEKNVDICIYGHTHIQHMVTLDGIIYLNPGALSNKTQNYAIYENGQITLY